MEEIQGQGLDEEKQKQAEIYAKKAELAVKIMKWLVAGFIFAIVALSIYTVVVFTVIKDMKSAGVGFIVFLILFILFVIVLAAVFAYALYYLKKLKKLN